MLIKLFSNISRSNIDFRREIIGGIVNFIAISYIIIVNPLVLNASGNGFAINATTTATILIIISATLLASILIKLPFVLAPGMGINALIGYTLILKDHIAGPTVLGMILISSILFFVLSITNLRTIIVRSIPEFLQIALGCGIGAFIFLIGLKNSNLIIANPDTIISLNKFALPEILSILGFVLTASLFIRHKAYAMLLPIVLITIISMCMNYHSLHSLTILRYPDFSLFLHINILSALKLSLLPSILTLFIVNFFDSTSTAIGLLKQEGLTENFNHKTIKNALITDSVAGIMSSIVGTSPAVIFIESVSGIKSGARTGIASLVTAIICIPFLFLSPLLDLVPPFATTPVLMLVGLLMLSNIKNLKLNNLEDIIAAAILIIMMPLTFSITSGAAFGIATYVLLKICLGKFKDVSLSLLMLAIICTMFLIL